MQQDADIYLLQNFSTCTEPSACIDRCVYDVYLKTGSQYFVIYLFQYTFLISSH